MNRAGTGKTLADANLVNQWYLETLYIPCTFHHRLGDNVIMCGLGIKCINLSDETGFWETIKKNMEPAEQY